MADVVDLLIKHFDPLASRKFWQHPRWWQLANQHLFGKELKLVVVTDSDGAIVAALPVQRDAGLLKSPQHPHLTIIDSLWIQSISPISIEQVMDAVLQHTDAWGWNSTNVPATSQIAQCQQNPRWQWRVARQSAWFDTTGDLPIPGKLRRNLARHERHLEENGELSYSCFDATDAGAITQAIDDFLRLEAAGWKGSSGTAIESDPTLKDFYLELKQFNTPELLFEVHQLHQQTRCIAVQLAMRCGSSRYLLKIAYDEACGAYSPGSLLLWRTLQYSVNDDTESLSLVSSPDWATRWKPETFSVWHVTRFSKNLQGALHLQADRLKTRIKDKLGPTHNRTHP